MKLSKYECKIICEQIQAKKNRIEKKNNNFKQNKKWQQLDAQEQLIYYYIEKSQEVTQSEEEPTR